MRKNLLLKIAAMTLMAIAFVSCKQEIQPTGIKLSQSSLALETGTTANLVATVEPAGAIGEVSWSSSNDAVASINGGVVTAKSAGTAIIMAKVSTFSATCSVTVTDPFVTVTSVDLDKASLALVEGDTATLTATVKPDNATDKTVTWSSDNTAVATVADGVVTAVSEGTAKITAKAGDVTATCEVSVAKKVIAVESVSLDKTSLELTEGETATLTATVKPDDATDKTVTWSSDNTAVATVADGVVTAVATGTAKITAKAGDASAVCTVTVKANVVKVTEIKINEEDFGLKVGETKALTVTVKPDNATDKSVTWSSDQPGIASVSADGVVTAVAAGNAKITAKANGGENVSDVVNVTVTADEPAGETKFEDWLGTWEAKSGTKKNTLTITTVKNSSGDFIENLYFVYGWQKFTNLPFVGSYMEGDLAFHGGIAIIEDAELFEDDPELYDLVAVGWFKYQGDEYFLTDDDYVTAVGSLEGNKCTMEAASFEMEGATYTFTKVEFLVKQKTGDDAGTYYRITNEKPLPFPVTLTKSSTAAPAMAPSQFKASGVKFEKVPINQSVFKR